MKLNLTLILTLTLLNPTICQCVVLGDELLPERR